MRATSGDRVPAMPSEDFVLAHDAPNGEALNLYIEVESGKIPRLETVAKSSLGFIAALKEAAYIVDPSLNLEIGIISSTQGSLSVNSVLKSLGKPDNFQRKSLYALALTAMLWPVKEAAS